MSDRTIKSQIISGLQLAAKTILAIATAGIFFGSLTAIISPSRVRPDSFLVPSPASGWILLAVATTILIATMNRWVKILPGVLGYSTLGGLIMLASGQYNKVPVPRLTAILLILFTVASSLLSLTFQERRLSIVDRLALLGFLFCLAFSATPTFSTMLTALAIGVGCLLLAWTIDRIEHRGDHGSSRQVNRTATGRAEHH